MPADPITPGHDPVCTNDRWDRAEHDFRCVIWASDDPSTCDCAEAPPVIPRRGDLYQLGDLVVRVEAVTTRVELREVGPSARSRLFPVTLPLSSAFERVRGRSRVAS